MTSEAIIQPTLEKPRHKQSKAHCYLEMFLCIKHQKLAKFQV